MNKDSELRGWKAHCVELQDQVERLEAEIARLKSAAVDAANAIDCEIKYCDMMRAENCRLHGIIDEINAPDYTAWIIEKLSYHRFERDDMSIVDCLKYLSNEWVEVAGRTTRQLVMQILSMLAGQQQSPAVGTPGWVMSAIRQNLCPAESCDFHGNQDTYLTGGCCKSELQNAICYLESLPSPRITEQDAREIALNAMRAYIQNPNLTIDALLDEMKIGVPMINSPSEAKNHG